MVDERSETHGAHTDFEDEVSYGDYLELDRFLDCQIVRSDAHDEMLFIIIHQATELWIKLMVHELRAAIAHLRVDELPPAFKMLARIHRIQAQMIQSWDVLSTLTPNDYILFRESFGRASGFQSYQYRMLEFALGNKQAGMPEASRPTVPIFWRHWRRFTKRPVFTTKA